MSAPGVALALVRNVRMGGPTARLLSADEPVDVFLADGKIADIAPRGALPANGEVLDADGAWAIPGLWDHHVHLTPWALRSGRTSLRAVTDARSAAALIGVVAPDSDGIRIGIEYRDALWPDEPTLAVLDAATGAIPTYLVNADLHSVWLNTAALAREGITDADGTGVLREAAAFDIGRRLDTLAPNRADAVVAGALEAAATRGVTGLVDFDFAWNADAWQRQVDAGCASMRVRFGIYPEHLERAIARDLHTGDSLGGQGLVRVGSLKVIADGSLGTRTAACSHPYPDATRGVLTYDAAELTMLIARAAAAGLDAAVHGIGDVAVTQALDAFARTGASGSIEHAQLVAPADLARFGHLGVTASVQPAHALDDRELVASEWAEQRALAYPLRSLHLAGANIVFGSDAPVTPLDPWGTIADAVARRRQAEERWRPEEALDVATALAASTARGSRATVELSPGADADIAVCAIDPFSASVEELRSMPVYATLVAGRITHLG